MRLVAKFTALVLAALSPCAHAAPEAAVLAVPPAGYTFAPVPECPFPGVVYHACEDQMQRFAAALAAAKAEDKLLLIVLGADWCPWCRALDALLPGEKVLARKDAQFDYAGGYALVNIAVSALAKGRRVAVPSGEAVADLVLARAGVTRRASSIPYLLIVDPRSGGVVHRQTGDLLDVWSNTGGGGHDPEKVRDVLRAAHATLRPGN